MIGLYPKLHSATPVQGLRDLLGVMVRPLIHSPRKRGPHNTEPDGDPAVKGVPPPPHRSPSRSTPSPLTRPSSLSRPIRSQLRDRLLGSVQSSPPRHSRGTSNPRILPPFIAPEIFSPTGSVVGGMMVPVILASKRLKHHPLRHKIISVLESTGYSTVKRLAAILGVSRASVLWHLYTLEREGVVESEKICSTRVFYLAGRRRRALHSYLLSHKTRRSIIEALKNGGPMGVSSLSKVVGAAKSTVKHHLNILEDFGFVARTGSKYMVTDLC